MRIFLRETGPRSTRVLASVLFLIGIPWSLIAWIGLVGAPIGAIEDLAASFTQPNRKSEAVAQLPIALLFMVQSTLGYAFWGIWLQVATGRLAVSGQFWFLAALHHLLWVLLAVPTSGQVAMPLERAIVGYSATMSIICLTASNFAAHRKPQVNRVTAQ